METFVFQPLSFARVYVNIPEGTYPHWRLKISRFCGNHPDPGLWPGKIRSFAADGSATWVLWGVQDGRDDGRAVDDGRGSCPKMERCLYGCLIYINLCQCPQDPQIYIDAKRWAEWKSEWNDLFWGNFQRKPDQSDPKTWRLEMPIWSVRHILQQILWFDQIRTHHNHIVEGCSGWACIDGHQ